MQQSLPQDELVCQLLQRVTIRNRYFIAKVRQKYIKNVYSFVLFIVAISYDGLRCCN